jgi:GT2 family glycosyltransferase
MIQCRVLYQQHREVLNSTGVVVLPTGESFDRDLGVADVNGSGEGEVFCPTAGAALYRRSMLEQIRLPGGYFDACHFMYAEDTDLGWRARLAGWRAWYAPEAVVYHRQHGTSFRHGPFFVRRMVRINRVRMLLKNASLAMLVGSRRQTVLDMALSVHEEGPSILREFGRAWGDGLRARTHVGRLQKLSREELERRWITGPKG